MVEETKEVVEDRKKKLEEEQKKLDKEQVPTETTEVPKPQDMIDKANEAAERLERVNKTHEELIIRQERLAVQNRLGGESEMSEKKTPEETETARIKKGAQALIPKGTICPGVSD